MENIEQKERKQEIQWQPLIEMIIVLVTILGSTLPLYLHTSTQIDAIHTEIRDFHGRLEKIDSEFKSKMAIQDCEFKVKMAFQDQEFKNKIILIEARIAK
jgi:hypothetical protein